MKQELVLVTGATSGIGLSICAAALSRGMHVIAIERYESRGEKLRALLADDPLSEICAADLSQESEVQRLCNEIIEKDISLSWIVHAAGMLDEREKTESLSARRVQECFQVNTLAPMRITELLETLITPQGGVICIGSVAGILGNSGYPVYSATKAALHNFGLSLSRKWSGSSRRSVVVAPGGTNTRMRQKTAGDAATSQSPEFVAGVVLDILTSISETQNGDVVLVKNNTVSKY